MKLERKKKKTTEKLNTSFTPLEPEISLDSMLGEKQEETLETTNELMETTPVETADEMMVNSDEMMEQTSVETLEKTPDETLDENPEENSEEITDETPQEVTVDEVEVTEETVVEIPEDSPILQESSVGIPFPEVENDIPFERGKEEENLGENGEEMTKKEVKKMTLKERLLKIHEENTQLTSEIEAYLVQQVNTLDVRETTVEVPVEKKEIVAKFFDENDLSFRMEDIAEEDENALFSVSW